MKIWSWNFYDYFLEQRALTIYISKTRFNFQTPPKIVESTDISELKWFEKVHFLNQFLFPGKNWLFFKVSSAKFHKLIPLIPPHHASQCRSLIIFSRRIEEKSKTDVSAFNNIQCTRKEKAFVQLIIMIFPRKLHSIDSQIDRNNLLARYVHFYASFQSKVLEYF